MGRISLLHCATVLALGIGTDSAFGQVTSKTLVSPLAYTGVKGEQNAAIPFSTTPYSYMQIHDDLAGTAKTITAIAFRSGIGSALASSSPRLSLRLSTARHGAQQARPTYRDNHGTNLIEVITNQLVHFPLTTASQVFPQPFTHKISFPAKPFLFPGKGSLAWELRIHAANSQTTTQLDLAGSIPANSRIGTGGIASDQSATADFAYAYARNNPATPGTGKLYGFAGNLPPNQPYLQLSGFSRINYLGLPLPLDLTPLGGPGNHLYVSPDIISSGTTSGTGTFNTWATGFLSFPMGPALAGLTLYTQVMATDPGNQFFPLVCTNALAVPMPQAFPISRIHANNATALLGKVSYEYGLITAFTYK